MNPPYELFLFGVVFFGFFAVVGVVQARRKKEKAYYLSAMVSFAVLLAFVFAFLNQFILFLILMIAVGVFSITQLPRILKVRERELTKRLQETDFKAPLRRRYFLSDIWWLRLAYKWGFRKTMGLFYLVSMSLSAGMLYILSTLYSFISIEYVVVFAAVFSVLFTFMFYKQFKKAFAHVVEGQQVEKMKIRDRIVVYLPIAVAGATVAILGVYSMEMNWLSKIVVYIFNGVILLTGFIVSEKIKRYMKVKM
jgi:hypothetical protein